MTDIYSWILSPEVREHLRKTYPLSTLDKTRLICGAFRSIEEKETALRALLEEAEVIGKGPQCASKRKRVDGRWQVAIGFDVHQVNGVYCATRFWHIDGWLGVDGIVEETMDIQAGYDEYYPEQILYPIPFMTGDLVKLDAPMFDEPLYGVMDNVVDLNGTPYRWLGYVDGDHLNVMPLSGNLLDFDSGYRVVDWLPSAKPEELAEGEEILWKFRCWKEIPFSELLAQVREARRGHG